MTTDYTSSNSSDEDIMEAQIGSRKRRKLSIEPDSGSEEDLALKPAALPSRVTLRKKLREAIQPTVSVAAPPAPKEKVDFATIDVAPWLVGSLASMEIKRPTGIQKACIPEILKGRDCIGGSRTGTGKTIAFSVPILQKWAEDPCGIFALIIT
jgi:ATP-dependent RNA helicase DDX49/DBP8